MSNIRKAFIGLLAAVLIATPINYAYAAIPTGIKVVMDGDAVIATKGSDGYFYLPVYINGKVAILQVDTGAGETVLNEEDAIALGLGSSKITDTKSFITGNGEIKINGTRVTVQVGNVMFNNVPVYANPGWIGKSVIGLSLLRSFQSVMFNNQGIRVQP